MFFFNFSDFQIIGASPEILVRLRDNKITVRPIAGTRPRGKTLAQDKFYEKAESFMLYPTTDGEYLTYAELETALKDNQTDKEGKLIFLYASNEEEQHQYIQTAKDKGYKVLLLNSPIIAHLIQKLEGDKENIAFARVDGDAVENLIKKEESVVSKLSDEEKEKLKPMIESVVPGEKYTVQLEAMDSSGMPFVLTQPEFMRRMKEMQQTGGGGGMFGASAIGRLRAWRP